MPDQDNPQDPSVTTPPTDQNANPDGGNNPPPPDNPPPQPQQTGGDPTILAAYQQQLLTESRERARLQRELDEARKPKEQPPTPDDEKQFFDRPVSVIKELVKREIGEAVRPFNQSILEQQRTSLIAEVKRQMRNNPAQFPYINQVENLFDQILSTAQQIDANVAVAAYNTALGYHISQGGRLETQAPANPPSPTRQTPVNTNPPHVRPSAPPPPNPSAGKKLRTLTENERKIARFNGQTDEQYIAWTDGIDDPKEVATITDEELIKRVR